MQPRRRRRLPFLPFSRLLPNLITIGGLCCGLSAMRFALEGKFEAAVTLIVAAAVIDGMDGRIARLLGATSTFGAQLDSLSDFVCFGIMPALIIYLWKLSLLKSIGWALVLFYVVCCALRLARFNTNLIEDSSKPWQKKFFVGVPSPAGAMLCLLPLVSSFYAEGMADSLLVCVIWLPLVGILMASKIPTFAVKKLEIHHEWVLPLMLACGLGMVIMLIEPWIMFTVIGLGYLAAMPFSIRHYRHLQAQDAPPQEELFPAPALAEPQLHYENHPDQQQ